MERPMHAWLCSHGITAPSHETTCFPCKRQEKKNSRGDWCFLTNHSTESILLLFLTLYSQLKTLKFLRVKPQDNKSSTVSWLHIINSKSTSCFYRVVKPCRSLTTLENVYWFAPLAFLFTYSNRVIVRKLGI